jgi:hypothetical protein
MGSPVTSRIVRRAAVATWCIFVATCVLSLAAPRAGGTTPHTPSALVLVDQTEWVVAHSGSSGAPTPVSPFDLGISARDAPSGAAVQAVLYPRLLTRYDFKNVLRDGPHGYPLSATTPVPLASLPPNPRSSGVSLDLSIVQSASSEQGSRLGLACSPATGSGTCTGVYPVVVPLQRPSGRVLRHFTTFLTYVTARSAHPLELSWIVPLQAPISLSRRPSAPARAIRPLSSAEAASLEILISQLRATPLPVTLDVSPETLQALDRAGPDGRAAVATLAALSSNPSTYEVLARPYAPVDLGALAGAGEPTEIVAQMAAGSTVLHHLHVRTTPTPSPWVQTGAVGNDIAGGLEQVHATQLVVAGTALSPTSTVTSSGTWTSTFSLGLTRRGSTTSVVAAEADSLLGRQFAGTRTDPALAATQLLADLAMVHFERPNTTAVRGLVALPPRRWVANPAFDRVLLEGLSQDPVVEPVTLSRYFSSVTFAGSRHLLGPGPGPVMPHALARVVSRARIRLSSFDGVLAGHPLPPVASQLDDLLLASESAGFSERRQASGVSTVERLLTDQLRLVRFATEKTFTLTSRAGQIPITVESHAPYTIVGRLTVSGNKFLFPHHGTSRVIRLDHATNASRVDVVVRSPGDLRLRVVFTSPDGHLVIARALLIVRSTATSVVGVVLTVAALAILLTWWARTWWSGRHTRRERRSRRERRERRPRQGTQGRRAASPVSGAHAQ